MPWIKDISHELAELIKTLPSTMRAVCVVMVIVLVAGWFYLDRIYDHMEIAQAVNDKKEWTDSWKTSNYVDGTYDKEKKLATQVK